MQLAAQNIMCSVLVATGDRLIWADICVAGQDKAAMLGSGQGPSTEPMEGQAVTQLQQQKAVLTSLAVDPGMPMGISLKLNFQTHS